MSYYGQAIRGQCQIIKQRRPITELLSDTNTPALLRNRLQLVTQIRAFADEELKLPADDHYTRYADVGRPFVVWNVHAAPELSFEAKSWWYPLVGRLDYRGYFSEAGAQRYAAELRAEGFEVFVGGVDAYSTLGWFQDPVLNTFVFEEDVELAELLFHELAHQRLFVSGDTDFNEAFATAVAEEGLRRWMLAGNDAAAWQSYENRCRRQDQFIRLLLAARKELEVVYGEQSEEDDGLKDRRPRVQATADWQRTEKRRVIERLRRDYQALKMEWQGYEGYDGWFEGPLNNAQLNTVANYYELVPAFRRLLALCDGHLERFYREAKALGKLPEKTRHRQLRQMTEQSARPVSPPARSSAPNDHRRDGFPTALAPGPGVAAAGDYPITISCPGSGSLCAGYGSLGTSLARLKQTRKSSLRR